MRGKEIVDDEELAEFAEHGVTGPADLSRAIGYFRARQGLKQNKIARDMKVNPTMPSLWENGKRLVPINRIADLAVVLEITVKELLTFEPKVIEEERRALEKEEKERREKAEETTVEIRRIQEEAAKKQESFQSWVAKDPPKLSQVLRSPPVDWSGEDSEVGEERYWRQFRTLAIIPDTKKPKNLPIPLDLPEIEAIYINSSKLDGKAQDLRSRMCEHDRWLG